MHADSKAPKGYRLSPYMLYLPGFAYSAMRYKILIAIPVLNREKTQINDPPSCSLFPDQNKSQPMLIELKIQNSDSQFTREG